MKQLIQDMRSGETHLVDVPVPQPGPGAALVRTAASVVSAGTERTTTSFGEKSLLGKARARPDLVSQLVDKARQEGPLAALETVRTRLGEPMTLGYSSSGTVVAVGPGLTEFHPGDRVVCAGGGHAVHAEYAQVPKHLLAHLPDNVNFESGAFATLGAIALHGFRLCGVQVGEQVAVIGMGLLGQLALAIIRASGARAFGVDLAPERVAQGREQGFEAVVRAEAESAGLAFTRGAGFDAVLICADTTDDDPVELAGELARDRAHVAAIGAVGMNLPRRLYYAKELQLVVSRSYGPGRYDPSYEDGGHDYPIGYVRWTEARNLEAFVALLAGGHVDVTPLISHRIPIDQAADAYRVIRDRDSRSLGVVLTYPEPGSPAEIPGRRIELKSPAVTHAAVRLGVLGAGNFATSTVFPILGRLKGVEKLGLASAGGLRGAEAGRRYGFAYATSDEHEVFNDPNINTVAILTRHDLHARQAVEGLSAGKHVVCEKPPALTQAELRELHAALQTAHTLYSVGYNRRFAPFVKELKAHFDPAGEPLVCLIRVNAGWIPEDHWVQDPEEGGGRLLGEACHFVDLMLAITGSLPAEVWAGGLPDAGRYRGDNFGLQVRFENGSLGTLVYVANGDRGAGKERIEVFGGGRSGVLDDFRTLKLFAGNTRKSRRAWLRQDKGHRAMWEVFVNSVTNQGRPPIPYEQILATSMTTFAALESLQTGEPVTVHSLPME